MANETRTLADDLREGGYATNFYIHSRFDEGRQIYSIDSLEPFEIGWPEYGISAFFTRYDSQGKIVESGKSSSLKDHLGDNRVSPDIVDKILAENPDLAEEK